jgi:hypothetical protein
MSDNDLAFYHAVLTLLGTVVALVGTVFTGVMAFLMARLNAKAREAAVKVEQVAEKVDIATVAMEASQKMGDAKLEEIASVGRSTHRLCNSAMMEQKRMLAETSRAKADMTNDPIDVAAADLAEQSYKKHCEQQRKDDDAKEQEQGNA